MRDWLRRRAPHLVGQRAGALDARLLLGAARGGAPVQPLGLAAQGVSQDHLAALLGVHAARSLSAGVGRRSRRPRRAGRPALRRSSSRMRVETRCRKRRSWVTVSVAKGPRARNSSSHTMLSTSRWLVGSSSRSRSGRRASSRASATRFCQPPESDATGVSAQSPSAPRARQRELAPGISSPTRPRLPCPPSPRAHRWRRRQLGTWSRQPTRRPRRRETSPSSGGVAPGQDPQQRRFARAVRADEADALAVLDGEAHALEERPRAEGRGEPLRAQQDSHVIGPRACRYLPSLPAYLPDGLPAYLPGPLGRTGGPRSA